MSERLFFFFVLFNFSFFPSVTNALFLNNETNCEQHQLVGSLDGAGAPIVSPPVLDCGLLSSSLGLDDCFAMRDPQPSNFGVAVPTYSQLENQDFQLNDNCFNLGGQSQFLVNNFTNQNTTTMGGAAGLPLRFGSLVIGEIGASEIYEDVYHALVNDPSEPPTAVRYSIELFSEAGGGFANGNGDLIALEAGMPLPLSPFPAYLVDHFSFTGIVDQTAPAFPSSEIFDCDQDGNNEVVLAVANPGVETGLLVLDTDNSGVLPADTATQFFAGLPYGGGGNSLSMSIGALDANQDGLMDIAATLSGDALPGAEAFVMICEGQGACSFNCPQAFVGAQVRSLSQLCPVANCFALSRSLTSGDFNGDGGEDFAVAEGIFDAVGNYVGSDVRYFFNDNASLDLSTWSTQAQALIDVSGDEEVVYQIRSNQFTVEAYASGVREVVAAVGPLAGALPPFVGGFLPHAQVFPSDGQGGLASPIMLNVDNLVNLISPSGLATGDFDGCGGQDVVEAFNTTDTVVNQSAVWMNQNEAPVISVNFETITQTEAVSNIQGTCEDPTRDNRVVELALTSAPAGANVLLGPVSFDLEEPVVNFNATFQTDAVGEYEITLTCTDPCGLEDTQIINYSIQEEPQLPLTQGSCIASLGAAPITSLKWVQFFMLALVLSFFILKRKIN